MPDDQTTEEIAEQTNEEELPGDVDDAMSSFMEDDGEDETPGDETDEKPTVEEKKPMGKKKPEASEKKEDDDDSRKEYPDALTERLKTSGQQQEQAETPSATKPPAQTPEPEKKAPAPVEDFDNLMSIDDLPDKEIKVGDLSVNLKEYKKDYPEDFAAIMAVGSILAKTIVQKQLQSGEFVKADKISDLHNEIQDIKFWDQISSKHSDARKINKDPAFLSWLDSQDEPLKRLARGMETPEDGILILDFYKKSKGKQKASDFDIAAKGKKKRTDDLHKGTMRNRATVKQRGDVDPDDAEAAFNEDDEDEL